MSLRPQSTAAKVYEYLEELTEILDLRRWGITPLGLALALGGTAVLVSLLYADIGLYAMTFGAIGVMAAVEALEFLAMRRYRKMRSQFAAYVNTFAGFFTVSGNSFSALKSSALPAYGYVARVISEETTNYERGFLGLDSLYDRIAERLKLREYFRFFKLLKVCEMYGGNTGKMVQKLQERLLRSLEAETMVSSTSQVSVFIVYLLIVLDLVGYRVALTDPETSRMVASTPTGALLLLYNVIAVFIALLIARNIRRTGSGDAR
jgi:Flp pilus assembly protein TadB